MPANHQTLIPRYLDLELTNACPADCPMCPREHLPQIGIMTEATFTKVTERVREAGNIQFISLCGIGEALLHPHIFDYIARLKALPVPPVLCLVTGGEKLTPSVFEKLKNLKVDIVELSLQAIDPQLYQQLMPGLKLVKVLQNIDYASQQVPPGMRFSLNIVVHRLNQHHIPVLLEFAKSKNLPVSIRKIHSRGGNIINQNLLFNYPPLNKEFFHCKVFENINFIAWTGKVHLCCQDARREFIIGDLHQDSFADIAAKKTGILAEEGLTYKLCERCDDEFRFQLL